MIRATNVQPRKRINEMAIQDEKGPVLVTVYCDKCGEEETNDYLVPAGEDSLVVARQWLKENKGWTTRFPFDFCPSCTAELKAKESK